MTPECPSMIPDRQPCDLTSVTAFCDYGSYCVNGYCQKSDEHLTCYGLP